MPSKFLNLLAAASLAVISCTYGPESVSALSLDSHGDLLARRGVHHGLLAKKRAKDRRPSCRKRPASSSDSVVASLTSAAASTESSIAAAAVALVPTVSETYTGGPGYTGGGGKGCLAWPNGDTGNLATWKTNHVSCLYTWSSWPVLGATAAGFEVLPQLWGDKDIGDFVSNIGKYNKPTWVLGFNEPNESGQSNMSPDHAVELWWKYMEPLKAQGHKLVSPAVSSSPAGFDWMVEFFAKCQGCHIDMVATHYYDVTVQGFIDYQTKYHDQFHLPILVTEFACQNFNGGAQCSPGDILNFLDKTTAWMDSTDWILKYMYFGTMHDLFNVNYDNLMMASDGSPNALGWRYINGY